MLVPQYKVDDQKINLIINIFACFVLQLVRNKVGNGCKIYIKCFRSVLDHIINEYLLYYFLELSNLACIK